MCFSSCSWWLSGGTFLLAACLSVAFYCILYLEWYCGIQDYDEQYPALIPVATATFIAAAVWWVQTLCANFCSACASLGDKWAHFIASIISVILLHVLVTVSVPCSIISCTSNFIHKARVAIVETVYCVLGDVLDLFCLENLGGKGSFYLC